MYFALVSISGNYISNKVDTVAQNYSAQEAGIQVGDQILKIDNKKIRLRSDVDTAMQNSNGNEIKVLIKRNNETKEIELKPTPVKNKSIGIYLGAEDSNLTSEIKGLFPNSKAQDAGLKEGDIITKIDGELCENDPYKVVELITSSKNEKIQVEVKRNNEIKKFEITPEEQTTYKLGVTFVLATNNFVNNVY